MTIKKKVNFFQIFLLFFVKWLWNLHNPVQDRELPKNVLILSQNIENKWKKSFSEESKLCPCWGTVGGDTPVADEFRDSGFLTLPLSLLLVMVLVKLTILVNKVLFWGIRGGA